MKKLVNFVIIFCLLGAFFTPSYAAESAQTQEVTEVIIPETEITLASETTIIQTNNEQPKGNGALVEDVNNDEVNRQFITVQSKGGNIFYIIIDNDGKNENVYFLNAVDDFDLLSFSENFPDGALEAYEELKEEAANNSVIAGGSEDFESEESVADSTELDNQVDITTTNNTQIYILVGAGVLFVLGLVYFKLIKPKKDCNNLANGDYDEDEGEDDL